ncbi:GNAT family N-acetyltransferase [Tengunoibacter tsumagoiensis]|uniref:N-acetyltransferase n=1 Tax=Tengunoibacter tsumagoiensis TaxID=2014871 RepID=A0A401ZXR4_9CHLR|nr:GNAT family protein [Tengunoibacter tsumagoiensis]GCE11630.1 N-acetyltransferase [Tengunoibacter tsumagoiensis]
MSIDRAFTTFPILTTERLRLRQVQIADARDLFPIFSDPETTQFYGHDPHRSLDETEEQIKQNQRRYAERQLLQWILTFKDADRVIGNVSLFNFGANYRRAEIGYILERSSWGMGVMSEAIAAVLTYAFSELNLHRIEAIIDIANERSKRLLLKSGFTYEGVLRERYPIGDHLEDEHYFGLLQHEWSSLRSRV